MNVHEPLTNLFPEELLIHSYSQKHLTADISSQLSDLFIIYLHILCPDGFRNHLPSISHAWSGFGQGEPAEGGYALDSRSPNI